MRVITGSDELTKLLNKRKPDEHRIFTPNVTYHQAFQ